MEDENSGESETGVAAVDGSAAVVGQGSERDNDSGALAAAVGRYRELVAQLPGLVPEMVQGGTIEEVDASAEQARQAYLSISRRVAEQYESLVPTGNPARSAGNAAYTNLTPEAKIAMGLKRHS